MELSDKQVRRLGQSDPKEQTRLLGIYRTQSAYFVKVKRIQTKRYASSFAKSKSNISAREEAKLRAEIACHRRNEKPIGARKNATVFNNAGSKQKRPSNTPLHMDAPVGIKYGELDWSLGQRNALHKIAEWIKDKNSNQVFRLYGYAGTGKTTILRYLAEKVRGGVAFAAFTGKAASVMRDKGCRGAQTIHSLIYKPMRGEDGKVRFVIARKGPASSVRLIVIDEASMVDEQLGRDLLSFGKKVLVVGDPFQLPPVKDAESFFTRLEPDVMLTEIHRQAVGNPIIDMATAVRLGRGIHYGEYGDSAVVRIEDIAEREMLQAGQVLVGMNKTRAECNARIRDMLRLPGRFPVPTDKLVCLKNNKIRGIYNGEQFYVHDVLRENARMFEISISRKKKWEDATQMKVKVLREPFLEGKVDQWALIGKGVDYFDFGYAMTVHKAQGSQWDHVMVFDESWVFKDNADRWLYTAITRAAKRVTVVR